MLRKFLFLVLSLFVFTPSVFAYTESGGFASGECDYGVYGMLCASGGCSSNQRCLYKETFTKTNFSKVYVGECTTASSEAPCPDKTASSSSFSEGCNTSFCSSGYKAIKLYSRAANYPPTGQGVTDCGLFGGNDCLVTSTYSSVSTSYACVQDASCSTTNSGCNYNDTNGNGGCASGEECWETPVYDSAGNKTGETVGTCVDSSNPCILPSNALGFSLLDYACSKETGCSMGEYCSDGGWSSNKCISVTPNIPSPADCFANNGSTCGSSVSYTGTNWPTGWTKQMYCKTGDYCANYSGGTLSKVAATAYSSYPAQGICITCAAGTDTANPEGVSCTGASQLANGAIDDCCNAEYKCGSDKKCHKAATVSFCQGSLSSPKPGSVCKAYGTTADYCNLCPVIIGGKNSRIDSATGNEYCLDITYNDTTITSSCTSDCGCPSGYSCNGGSCVSASSCVSPGDQCSSSGTPCCTPGDITYTCAYDSEARLNLCQSPECKQVQQTLQCTEATESCCPTDKPFCNNGTCGAVFECTTAGECCPGYGQVCDDNKQCVPADGDKCTTEDHILPPAPAYLGPKIEIPQLFSAIGAILYPAGIGIGLLFIARAGYTIMMSEGNPDEVKKGQENLTSAIIGTLFIVLSTTILRIIINTLLG